jgi:hypothetical protein
VLLAAGSEEESMRRFLALLTAVPLAAVLTVACGDDDTVSPPEGVDGGGDATADVTPTLDAGKDADAGPVDTEFTTFVKNLITNETRDTNLPTETENKTFTDKEDPAAFPPSFF